MEKFFNFVW